MQKKYISKIKTRKVDTETNKIFAHTKKNKTKNYCYWFLKNKSFFHLKIINFVFFFLKYGLPQNA